MGSYPRIRVVATSLAGLRENTAPWSHETADPERNLALGLSLLDGAGAQGADLALLPETFVTSGVAPERKPERVQNWDGADIAAVAERARRHRMFVVAGFVVEEGESLDESSRAVRIATVRSRAATASATRPNASSMPASVPTRDRWCSTPRSASSACRSAST